MSKLLSLKLKDVVFRDAEGIRRRNRLLKKQLATESAIVSGDSLEVLEVFEGLEDSLD